MAEKGSSGRSLAAASLGLNAALAAAKYLLFLATGSLALLAETVHSLTDVVGSLLVVGGVLIAERPSQRFPWGLYKVENLAALFSAGMIFVSAYGVARSVAAPAAEIRHPDVALVALGVMAVPVVLFARHERRRAAAIHSPALAADAENWRMDLAPLAVVAAGIAGAWLSHPALDRIAAAAVLFLVVRAGYGIVTDSMKSLLDASVDRGTLAQLEAIVQGFPEVKEVRALNARNSGRYLFVYLDVRLALSRLKLAHAVAVRLEREIKAGVPFVERVIVRFEPEQKGYTRYAAPLATEEGAVSEHFGSAPFLALWDRRSGDGAVALQEVTANPFAALEKGKGIRLAELLVARGVDVVYTREDFTGKGPEYVLSDADVESRRTDRASLRELMEESA